MLCYVSIVHICCSFPLLSTPNDTKRRKNMFAILCDNIWWFTKALIIHFWYKKCRLQFFFLHAINWQYCELCHTCNWHVALKIEHSFTSSISIAAFINEQNCVILSYLQKKKKYVKIFIP